VPVMALLHAPVRVAARAGTRGRPTHLSLVPQDLRARSGAGGVALPRSCALASGMRPKLFVAVDLCRWTSRRK
jgi:hypothetical protein